MSNIPIPVLIGESANGDLSGLNTNDKSSLVNAINETVTNISTINTKLNNLEVDVTSYKSLVTNLGQSNEDWTPAINAATLILSNATNSCYIGNCGGIIYFPQGTYQILSSIIMKSNITYKGAGIDTTIIKGNFTSGYIFDVTGTNHTSRLAQVRIEDMTIGSDTCSFTTLSNNRATCGGINLSYCMSVKIRRIGIFNLAGIAINQVENYDCTFDDMDILFCGVIGDDTKPCMTFLDNSDTTNAVHCLKLHVEQCGLILMSATTTQIREIQFVACKFEQVNLWIKSVNSVTFSDSNFVWSSNTNYQIRIDQNTGLDTRGLSFANCTFIGVSHTGNFINNINSINVTIINARVNSANQFITGNSNCVTAIIGGNAYDCNSPVIKDCQVISSFDIRHINNGTDYAINIADLSQAQIIGGSVVDCSLGIAIGGRTIVSKTYISVVTTGIYISSSNNVIDYVMCPSAQIIYASGQTSATQASVTRF
ncbi:glycosyl hydrolase family 28-related protein [Clostridium sp.]|uniref:glycosyl hydrolase family 28-related protein n=1 Tax=Clostridium sp. TaxID=1506 RepID=UPI002615BCAD|nr:glycosyl hydrolase family 28-related protein [Clostridium sp.]